MSSVEMRMPRVANHRRDALTDRRLSDIGVTLCNVEAPACDPLGPWPDGAQQRHAYFPEAAEWSYDPIENAWTVAHVMCEVRIEDRIHGPGSRHVTLDRQPERFHNGRLRSVSAEKVPSVHGVLSSGRALP